MNQELQVQKQTQGFGTVTTEKSAELAARASAESARAEVESAYIMAIKRPRSEEDARIKINKICGDPDFAQCAKYSKPIGNTKITGPSIRFAEEILRHWGNVKTIQNITYEDESKRILKVVVIDLESNLSYSSEVTLEKTVERKSAKGREVLGERENSTGELVYIVRATEDEMATKAAAAISKMIRNNGLRLIPRHITEGALDVADKAIRDRVNTNPDAEKQKVLDAFALLGIMPSEIEKYLKHPIAQTTPAEVVDLRTVYNSLKEGSAKWSDYVQTEEPRLTVPTTENRSTKAPAAEAFVVNGQISAVKDLVKKAGLTEIEAFDILQDLGIESYDRIPASKHMALCDMIIKVGKAKSKK